jgi:hypothetical protein
VDPLGIKDAAKTAAGAIPQVAKAIDEAGQSLETVASTLQATVRDALEKGSVDAALLANAGILELQAWRLELVEWRQMLDKFSHGVTITITPNPPA